MKVLQRLTIVSIAVIGLVTVGFVSPADTAEVSQVLKLMGSRFELIALAEDSLTAASAVQAGINEIRRVESLISSWDPESQTSAINARAGYSPVEVDPELLELIERALKVSEWTDGAFDISFAALDDVWHFDGTMLEIPDSSDIAASVRNVGYEDIILDPAAGTVFLNRTGMRIGFGAIGKGYAANRARMVMTAAGSTSGVVNAGGDLTAWGLKTDGMPWSVAIADPDNPETVLARLEVENGAVVTSGDYEKFAWIGGVRYAHIIDPRNGWPARGLRSVTVICPDAELADALATAVFVLGPEEGLALVNRMKHVECVMLTDEHELIQSANVDLLIERKPSQTEDLEGSEQ